MDRAEQRYEFIKPVIDKNITVEELAEKTSYEKELINTYINAYISKGLNGLTDDNLKENGRFFFELENKYYEILEKNCISEKFISPHEKLNFFFDVILSYDPGKPEENEYYDLYGHYNWILSGRCLSEVGENKLDEEKVNLIADNIVKPEILRKEELRSIFSNLRSGIDKTVDNLSKALIKNHLEVPIKKDMLSVLRYLSNNPSTSSAILNDIFNTFIKCLDDQNTDIRKYSEKVLGEAVKSPFITVDILDRINKKYKREIDDFFQTFNNSNGLLKSLAKDKIMDFSTKTTINTTLLTYIVENLISVLTNNDYYDIIFAVKVLGELTSSSLFINPDLLIDLIESFSKILTEPHVTALENKILAREDWIKDFSGFFRIRNKSVIALGKSAKCSAVNVDILSKIIFILISNLNNDEVRRTVLYALGYASNSLVITPNILTIVVRNICSALTDKDSVLEALGRSISSPAITSDILEIMVGYIINELNFLNSWDERRKLSYLICTVAKSSVINPFILMKLVKNLTSNLKSDNLLVRDCIAEVLGEVSKSPAITQDVLIIVLENLKIFLNDETSEIRATAAKALGEAAKTPVITHGILVNIINSLVITLDENNQRVVEKAEKSLENISQSPLITPELLSKIVEALTYPLQHEYFIIRAYAVFVLATIAKSGIITSYILNEIVLKLIKSLYDTDRSIRRSTFYILGEVSKSPAITIGILNKIITSLFEKLSNEDWDDRRNAVEALGEVSKSQIITIVWLTRIVEALEKMSMDDCPSVLNNATESLLCITINPVISPKLVIKIVEVIISILTNENLDISFEFLGLVKLSEHPAITPNILAFLIKTLFHKKLFNIRFIQEVLINFPKKDKTKEVTSIIIKNFCNLELKEFFHKFSLETRTPFFKINEKLYYFDQQKEKILPVPDKSVTFS